MYELIRLRCGEQEDWKPYTETLFRNSGVKGCDSDKQEVKYKNALKRFRLEIKKIAEEDGLPGYTMTYDERKDQVTFRPRKDHPENS
ncbi:MAG: replication initiator protein A [Candidatus Thiodiazotropha sp.]|nr:replication initiator protein A [Candidatus Thiodiazotropha sp.]